MADLKRTFVVDFERFADLDDVSSLTHDLNNLAFNMSNHADSVQRTNDTLLANGRDPGSHQLLYPNRKRARAAFVREFSKWVWDTYSKDLKIRP